jgi:protein-tyrosine phosphatase
MNPDIYKVTKIGKGFLSVMAKPVAGEWIEDEFLGISRYGINVLVSLLELHEIRELGLSKASLLCTSNGMDYINFPILDRSVPTPSPKLFSLIGNIHRRIELGENTVIHCRAGIGRTGLFAASILVKHGYSPSEAFTLISKARGVEVPDTQEQYEWVVKNKNNLQRT